ncbi:MAG TPA: TSUP family transporter, partial [Acidovorax sp.]|nr:TSUP family transporter [Acidovorax sp.]
MDNVWWVVMLGAAAAGFVQGLSGFGFSMVAMSVWAWALEPRLAAVLAVCGALTGQVVAAATVRRGFDKARLLPFVLGGLAGIPLGVALLPR